MTKASARAGAFVVAMVRDADGAHSGAEGFRRQRLHLRPFVLIAPTKRTFYHKP